MEENCYLQNLTIVTHGKWTDWTPWGECQFVTFPHCIGKKFRERHCFERPHYNYDNIKFICNGKKLQDDHCHIHLCLVAWTQLPLCGIIFVAFFLGASWELYDLLRRSRRKRIGKLMKIEKVSIKDYEILPEDGEIKTVTTRHKI